MRTERPTCRECACVKVCEYFQNENARNLDEVCPLCNWENYFVPKQEWISVEEMLPEANAQVLAINSDGEFYVATYIEHKISPSARGYMTWASGMYNGKPTHWMPLPEPPKMKGGAE